MKLKTLASVIVILAALSAIAYWANRPAAPAEADPMVGKPLADPAAIAKAAKIEISDQGKTVDIVRQPDGSWRDASYYDLPADFSKLSSFVNDVTTAKIQRLVTTSPTTMERLQFKDTKISFDDDTGHPLWSVVLGKNADSGGRFIRFGDESRAYLSDINAWLDTDPKNWADATLVNLKADDVAKIEIPFDGGKTVTVSRAKKDDPWSSDGTPAGQRVSADKISSVLSSLGALRFSDTSDPSDAQVTSAKDHLRSFRLTTFDGKTTTVAIGRKPEEKKLKPPSSATLAPILGTGKPDSESDSTADKKSEAPMKPPAPEYETIPAGNVYAFVTSPDGKSPIDASMGKRAFQVDDYVFTGLPQKASDLFETAPETPAKPSAAK